MIPYKELLFIYKEKKRKNDTCKSEGGVWGMEILFGALLLVHLLYDFHWQGDFIGAYKSKYLFLLFIHCLTYTLCIGAVLYWFNVLTYWKLALLLISHIVVDYWKCRLAPEETKLTKSLWIDQGLHFIVLLLMMF